MSQATEELTGKDAKFGYRFGVDGLMTVKDACDTLGGMSHDTLSRRAKDDQIRLGQFPGGRRVMVCRRSLMNYIARMEL